MEKHKVLKNTKRLKKLFKLILVFGIVLTVRFLADSIYIVKTNDTRFLNCISFLVSSLICMVIMIYILRQMYIAEKKRPWVFFSQIPMIFILLYATSCPDLIILHIFTIGIDHTAFIWELLVTLFFGLFCIVCVLVMIRENIKYKREYEKEKLFKQQ